MISALLAIFGPSNEGADVFFLIGVIGLMIVGVVTLLQNSEAWPHAVAWLSIACYGIAWLLITP